MNRYNFSEICYSPWMKSMGMGNVVSRFRAVGVFPVSREAVLSQLPAGDKVSNDHPAGSNPVWNPFVAPLSTHSQQATSIHEQQPPSHVLGQQAPTTPRREVFTITSGQQAPLTWQQTGVPSSVTTITPTPSHRVSALTFNSAEVHAKVPHQA
jgi:hypothetical protein